ncbi:hypothetical protein MSPP1_000318 [Malassezia sp. CBS 17886]|nr:hypothetical protein MSPP1_000318 [Malassezia sp. CBS 17886]
MDFTAAYQHASVDCIAFSPGSTFVAYIAGHVGNAVLVRVSGTLQVVRSWELDQPLHSLQWSQDGLLLLASSLNRCESSAAMRRTSGVSYVLPLDPDACLPDGSDDQRGWVARIDAGVQGLHSAAWLPVWRIPSIVQFAPFDVGGMVYTLSDKTVTPVPNTVLQNVYSNPLWPNHFALVQRNREHDYLTLYTPKPLEAGSAAHPVEWFCEKSIRLHTNRVQGVAWSPSGDYIAAWDHNVEFRVCVYSLGGTHLTTVCLAPDAKFDIPTSRIPVSAAECQAALSGPRSSVGRARRVAKESGSSQRKTVEQTVLPVDPPQSSSTPDAPPKKGVCWMEWNHDGTLLACRNESLPTTMFVYEFVRLQGRATDARLRLCAVVVLAAPITAATWKPGSSHVLSFVDGGRSMYMWTGPDEHADVPVPRADAAQQGAEAIAVPNDHFSAHRITWAPDGHSVVLSDRHTFCCAVTAPADDTEVQGDLAA